MIFYDYYIRCLCFATWHSSYTCIHKIHCVSSKCHLWVLSILTMYKLNHSNKYAHVTIVILTLSFMEGRSVILTWATSSERHSVWLLSAAWCNGVCRPCHFNSWYGWALVDIAKESNLYYVYLTANISSSKVSSISIAKYHSNFLLCTLWRLRCIKYNEYTHIYTSLFSPLLLCTCNIKTYIHAMYIHSIINSIYIQSIHTT